MNIHGSVHGCALDASNFCITQYLNYLFKIIEIIFCCKYKYKLVDALIQIMLHLNQCYMYVYIIVFMWIQILSYFQWKVVDVKFWKHSFHDSCKSLLKYLFLIIFDRVHSMIEKLAQFTDIRCCLVVGGLSTKVWSLFQFHDDL